MLALYDKLQHRYALGEVEMRRPDLAFVTVPREHLVPLLLQLRDVEGFSHLVLLTAVDWIERDLFQLTYLVNNRLASVDLGVRVMIPREAAAMDSIHHLWPTAATYQRELKEMFGIDFPGSPRIDDDFILEGWTDLPPYRRDFDTLKYSEETYRERPGRETRDPAAHMRERLYPGGED